MSHTQSLTPAVAAREVRALLKGASSLLTGKRRGPDHADDRRVPHRHSYEENDLRAKPWSKVGDGSVVQGIMHKEALVDAADALRHQLRAEYPRGVVRARRRERADLAAELAAIEALPSAEVPIGRPATMRMAITAHDDWLSRADRCLRRIDVDVLRGLLSFLTDFMTGALFPSHAAIAEAAGVHPNSVADGLKRLRHHGLIDWVRRTTRTGNAGEFGPQLEQTSNAYRLAVRALMSPRTWQHYWQRLQVKLRRLGAAKPPQATIPSPPPQPAPMTPFQAALASLGASVANATT
jgi:hypothetical protein